MPALDDVPASAFSTVSASLHVRSELGRYPSLNQERILFKHLIDDMFKGQGGFDFIIDIVGELNGADCGMTK